MLNVNFAALHGHFYPIGNTPALSLTEGIPFERDAHILLLGCGDIRHILFTAYVDRELGFLQGERTTDAVAKVDRTLDFTCCDLQEAIIARNILRLSLIIDDDEGKDPELMWKLFYHFKIDKASLGLLQVQARKLHSLSASLQSWHASKYGGQIRPCDSGSLRKVRDIWSFYGAERSDQELATFTTYHEACIRKSKTHENSLGLGLDPATLRSLFPLQIPAGKDVIALRQHYWKHGCTDMDREQLSLAVHLNPMFVSPDDRTSVYYGADPLLSFHLETAFVPLKEQSPLFRSSKGSTHLQSIVDMAKTEFQEWVSSLKDRAASSLTIRFFVGDALNFSYALQQRDKAATPQSTPLYRDACHFEELELDSEDYQYCGTAPVQFDIIDTSNLIDHVGALNLFTASSPLLKTDVSATFYTEKLVTSLTSNQERARSLLRGHLPTISMLLGLNPVDFVTNASAFCGAVESSTEFRFGDDASETSRTVQRQLEKIHFDPHDLALVLRRIYLDMFQGEDVSYLRLKKSVANLTSLSLSRDHRASFARFLRFVKQRTIVDWELTMQILVMFVETNTSITLGMNFIQELFLWLHLLDLHSKEGITSKHLDFQYDKKAKDLTAWTNIPPVVCITLKVPRTKLKPLTGGRTKDMGTPTINCVVQAPINAAKKWHNAFVAVQLGFGKVSTCGVRHSDSFKLSIDEDMLGWSGKSPLLASFYVPTWLLLQEPQRARVGFGLQHNNLNVKAFIYSLGLGLYVYRTTLTDPDNVYITKHFPNQSAPISICGMTPSTENGHVSDIASVGKVSTTAGVESDSMNITSLAVRVDLANGEAIAALRAGSQVNTTSKSPFTFVASLRTELSVPFDFPSPVIASKTKTRIARKSSYIELVSQVADGDDFRKRPPFLFPVMPSQGMIVSWNMPYLKLESLPIVDISQPSRLAWLKLHIPMMFSRTENDLRQNASLQASCQERDQIAFKNSLLSIFLHYAGVQGQRAHVFGISCPEDDGVHMLLLVSNLRLELSSRTVVLDAAVLPLHNALTDEVPPFLHTLTGGNDFVQITMNKAQMRLWKEVLPAWAERCRSWSHREDCQYLHIGKIPLSFEKGHSPLCACGEGVLPADFITNVPGWNTVDKYAVRVAISPVFSSPLVEDPWDDSLPEVSILDDQPNATACALCLKTEAVDGGPLKSCSRCFRAKYCSRECQLADWKSHKASCQKGD